MKRYIESLILVLFAATLSAFEPLQCSLTMCGAGANGGGAAAPLNQGWAFIQDAFPGQYGAGGNCVTSVTTCTNTSFVPSTSGSVLIAVMYSGTQNITVTSASSSGATWVHPAGCSVSSSANGSTDLAYSVNAPGGTSSITVNTNSAAAFGTQIIELLPPAGYTGAFDVCGSTTNGGSACQNCPGVALTTTGTDAIVQYNNSSGGTIVQWNSISPPYILDSSGGDGLYLNTATGSIAAPTFNYTSSIQQQIVAVAFTTTAPFTVVTPVFSVVNYTAYNSSGSASYSITVPSTTAGNLGYLLVSTSTSVYLSSLTCAGCTVVVPAACQITVNTSDALSCAYILSLPGSITSLSATLGSSATIGASFTEVHRTSGNFALDGSIVTATRAGQTGGGYTGATVTVSGSPFDVIFQGIFNSGGPFQPTLLPQPFIPGHAAGCVLGLNVCGAVLTNATSGAAPIWPSNQNFQTGVLGVAFK